jgi:hypothetical protein
MPRVARTDDELLDLLVEKSVLTDSGCLIWTGPAMKTGYGTISVQGRGTMVHRYAYERFVEPIPYRFEIDHLCFVRPCINVDHLEAVTRRENMRRQRGFLEYNDDREVAKVVLSLRDQGLTFTAVAATTGVSRSRAHRLATGQWQRTEEL